MEEQHIKIIMELAFSAGGNRALEMLNDKKEETVGEAFNKWYDKWFENQGEKFLSICQ